MDHQFHNNNGLNINYMIDAERKFLLKPMNIMKIPDTFALNLDRKFFPFTDSFG